MELRVIPLLAERSQIFLPYDVIGALRYVRVCACVLPCGRPVQGELRRCALQGRADKTISRWMDNNIQYVELKNVELLVR